MASAAKKPVGKKVAKPAAPKAAGKKAVPARTAPKAAAAKPARKKVGKEGPEKASAAPGATKAQRAAPAVSPAKTPAAVKPKPRKPPFTPKELAAIRENLIAHRAQLQREADELNAGSFDATQSEISGEVAFDEEYADAGTFTFERERDLSLGNNIRDLVDRIDLALVKIQRGTYGVCERCGEPITKERLVALPYSVLCVKCKQIEERLA